MAEEQAAVEAARHEAFARHDGRCPHCPAGYLRCGQWVRHLRVEHPGAALDAR